MNDNDQWWMATIGRTVIWARLRILDAGTPKCSTATASPSLRQRGHRSRRLDGCEFGLARRLDDEDARGPRLAIDELVPPHGDDDELLRGQMVQKRSSRH
jgi:hypothetical protein